MEETTPSSGESVDQARCSAEEYLAAIVASAEDAIIGKSLDGIIQSWNQGAERTFGYRADEVIGKPIALLIPADRLEEERGLLNRIRKGERIMRLETARVTKQGRVVQTSLTLSPVRSASGEVIGASTIARDITADKRLEQSLREKEERLLAALSASDAGTFRWDLSSDSIVPDEAAQRLIAAADSQPHPISVRALLRKAHPEDRKALLAAVERCRDQKTDLQVECRVIDPAGQQRWLAVKGKVFDGTGSEAPHIIGAVVDVTRLKQAEQEVRRSEERYRSLVEALSEGVVLMDRRGVIRTCNASLQRILGISADELLGRMPAEVKLDVIREDGSPFPPDAFPAMVTLHTGKPCENVIMGVRQGEEVKWISVNSRPLSPSGDAAPYAVVVSLADVTRQKRLEQRLKHQARVDPLTGISNRRRFMALATNELARARRFRHPLSVLMVDIDHFKAVNDRYGHHVGDQVLVSVVRACQKVLRDADILGRIGGEEFAVLLPEAAAKQALRAAERLRETVANTTAPLEQEGALRVTVSVGVATTADSDSDIASLLREADDALYQAKEEGRNRVRIAASAQDALAQRATPGS